MPEDVLHDDDGAGVSIKAPDLAAMLMQALFAPYVEALEGRVTVLETELARLKHIIDMNTGDGK